MKLTIRMIFHLKNASNLFCLLTSHSEEMPIPCNQYVTVIPILETIKTESRSPVVKQALILHTIN